MALEWEIKRWNPLGVAKPMITSADSILSIKNWAVDSFGNCQEAFLTALVSGLPSGVGGWEKMQLRYRPVAGTGAWIPLYVGRTMIPGTPKSTKPSEIKLVGLMDKLYKTPATKEFYGSANPATPSDIGVIARDIVNDARVYGGLSNLFLDESATTPEGATYSSIPNVGAVIGQIQVNGYRVGDLLDLLCQSWTGLHWGVNSDAKVFLKYYDPAAAGSPTVMTEGIDGCKPEYKPATFEKGCNWVDLYLSIPDTTETVLFTVKDDASIAQYGIEALPNPLVYSGLIEPIPDSEITYSQALVMYGAAGYTGAHAGSAFSRYNKTAPTGGAIDPKLFNDKEEGRKFNVQSGTFTWGYSSGSVPSDGFLDSVEFRLQATNVGLIRIQTEFKSPTSSNVKFGIRMFDRSSPGGANVGYPFIRNAPNQVALNDSNYNPSSVTTQNVRVDPTLTDHVLALTMYHYPSDTTASYDFAVSQFRPYRFNLQKINAIAKDAMNTPNPDAASVKQNTLVLPNTKITIISSLYPTVTKEAKLFKYTFEHLEYGMTMVELEQPQSAASTSSTAIINNKDAKTAISASQFSASVINMPASSVSKDFGSPLKYRSLSTSPTGTLFLFGQWGGTTTGTHGEFDYAGAVSDKTVGGQGSGADIIVPAMNGFPGGSLFELSCILENKGLGIASIWLAETSVAPLNSNYTVCTLENSNLGGFIPIANSGIKVLLDSNGRLKLRVHIDVSYGSGADAKYSLFANGLWSPE
jgi:hypothetical protein